jgi:O-methyltransferase involved in polyketide biosynthesis
MTEKHQVRLGETQETLLIPLYGRAVETRKRRALLRDPKAVEMVEAIEYDFARFDGGPSPFGTVLRTVLIDWWVGSFLDANPAATVVEIGCGLNTRFERLDNGQLRWIDLDLPDAMALRRRFFTETGRRRMLACSVLDDDWVAAVRASPGPYFFAVEAVLGFLPEPAVRQALGLIAGNFPQARVALDTVGRWMVANQDRHDSLSKVSARMAWGCDNPRELERWGLGLRLVDSRDLSQLPGRLRRRLPLSSRIMLPAVKVLKREQFARYKVNLFEVAPR